MLETILKIKLLKLKEEHEAVCYQIRSLQREIRINKQTLRNYPTPQLRRLVSYQKVQLLGLQRNARNIEKEFQETKEKMKEL